MLKMVDGTGIIGVDMVCPLGGTVSPPQPPNYDNIEMEGVGSLMLPNSLKAPLERLELIGNSRHKTYAGTQMFDASKLSTTSSGGATVTNNGDGSFTISGTGTLSKSLYTVFNYTHSDTIKLLKAGKITFNALATTNPKLEVSFRNNTDAFFIVANALNPVESAEIKQECLDDPGCYLSISFYAAPESTIRSGTITPMLYQDGNGEWEPFTGGKPVAEPSPDIPLEIESCGKRKKNLLDFKTAKIFNSVKKPEMLDNGFVLNATEANNRILYCECNLKAGKTYVLSYKLNKISGSANAKVSNHFPEINQYFNSGKPVVPNRDVSKIGFYVDMENVPAKFEITDVQVEEGTTVTAYEPYSDKYFIDVKVTGKNLLNISSETISRKNEDNKYNIQDGVITFNTINEWGGDFIYFHSVDTRNNKDLTFSANATLSEDPNNLKNGCRILINAYDKNGTLLMDAEKIFAENSWQWIYNEYYKGFCYYSRINESLLAKFADEVDKITVGVCYLNNVADYPVSISNVQVEYGTVTSNHEPYTEQTVQIALDEPLRGNEMIADNKNVQELLNSGGVTRHFKEVTITKDAPITCGLGQYGAPETNTVLCRSMDISLKKSGTILCRELKKINNWNEDEESVAMTEQGIDFRLSRERLGLGSDTTPEENKAAVIKYLTDHPLHCVAELNEPTTEPLPESVQQQLQALHSENGTTHVFVDSGEVEAGIKLTYRKEK